MTQAVLAERVGMTLPQLSRLQSGGAAPTVALWPALRQHWTPTSTSRLAPTIRSPPDQAGDPTAGAARQRLC